MEKFGKQLSKFIQRYEIPQIEVLYNLGGCLHNLGGIISYQAIIR